MRILVTGAHGFTGCALGPVLAARGDAVVAGVHRTSAAPAPAGRAEQATWRAAAPREVAVDFVRDIEPAAWRLDGIDAVVNTMGLIREHGVATFVHVQAAVALFDACAQLGIRHVVQLSALGADASAQTAYHRTKRAADEALLERMPSAWCALVEREGAGGRIALVGPAPLPFEQLLLALRTGLGLRATRVVHVPRPFMRAAARVGVWLPHSLLGRDTLAMLARGNAADAHPVAALLGHPPRPVHAFVAPAEASALRTAARLRWLLPLLRAGVALVWTGWLFTATTVVFQPLSGFWMAYLAGIPFTARWIAASVALYLLAAACWLPVVWMQVRMRDMARAARDANAPLPPRCWLYLWRWVALGIPAFVALVIVFWLMVVKPA